MKVVSVINYKGGVGKTTLTANLAAYLACLGKNVLLVDMDAQCSLTLSFMPMEQWEMLREEGKTLKGWFDKLPPGSSGAAPGLHSLVVSEKLEVNGRLKQSGFNGGVSLIPSDIDLLDVDLDLAPMLYSRGNSEQKTAEDFVRLHGVLREQIHSPAMGEYDAVLVDCPPNFNIVTKTAIVASDAIVTPVVPDAMSTRGIRHLVGKCEELANGRGDIRGYNAHLKILGKKKLPIPNIKAIVPMIWKVTSRGDGDYSQAHAQFVSRLRSELGNIIGDNGAKIVCGVRHRASFFAEAGHVPVLIQPTQNQKEVWGSLADTIQDAATQLGWHAPGNVWLSDEWDRLSQYKPHWTRPQGWKRQFARKLQTLLEEAEKRENAQ